MKKESNFIYVSPLMQDKFSFYKIISFDTESFKIDTGEGILERLAIAGFYDGNDYKLSYNYEDILKVIKEYIKKYGKISLVAHNYKYDAKISGLLRTFIFKDEFFGMKLSIKMLDKIFYVKYKSKNNERIFQAIDSTNYFKDKLSKLASMIGMNKQWDIEYSLPVEEWNQEVIKNGEKAVKEDCKILYEFMNNFIKRDEFSPAISQASISMNTFRRFYQDRVISFPKFLIDEALSSYHGGIVLPYNIGSEYLYSYDINSLYPFVMKEYEYSYKLHNKVNDYKYIYDHIKDKSYNYLLNVTYNIDFRSPILDYHDNRLIPFLSNTQWITSQEYVTLYDNNASIIINEAWEFYCADLFSGYIIDFYNRRLKAQSEKNDALSYFYKILLNSLYGKWAQHKAISEYFPIDNITEPLKSILLLHGDNERLEYEDEIYSIYDGFVTKTKELPVRYNPLIASEITANARITNYLISVQLGWDNIWYTDTDSFFSTKKAPSILLGNELGKLKIDDKGQKFGNFTIYSPKDYEWEQNGIKHIVLKGVKYKPIPINSIPKDYFNRNKQYFEIQGEFINPLFKKDNKTYAVSEQWSGIKSQTKIEEVLIQYKEKELKRNNYKMKYINGEGFEWKDKNEYDNRAMIIAK